MRSVNPSNAVDQRAVQGPDTYNYSGSRFTPRHETKTTTTLGRITPVLVKEMLPGDYIKIRTEVFTRFAPLYLPLMHRVDLKLNYFFVPYRILWNTKVDGWEDFITRKNTVEAPYFNFDTADEWINGSLCDYLGLPYVQPGITEPILFKKLLAFPIAAWAIIYDEYYRNPQLQSEIFQPLLPGNNTWVRVLGREKPKHDLWNRDYFTSALPQPLAGSDILMPLVHNDFSLSNGDIVNGPYRLRSIDDNLPAPNGNVVVSSGTYVPAVPGGLAADGGNERAYLDIQETAPSIRQLRVAAKMYEFFEHLNRSSVRYPDFTKGRFNVDPFNGMIDRPIWFGGFSTQVVVSEVLSMAGIPESNPLGSYAGQALASDPGKTVDIFCQEWGIIIANLVIKPRSGYMNGIHPMWTRFDPFDYPDVEFSNIGDQPILGQELFFEEHLDFAAYNEQEWGYVQRFFEWKQGYDLVTGNMKSLWKNFHLARIWEQGDQPGLNSEFVTCFPRTSDVFQISEGEDEIFVYCYHHITVNRRLPAMSIGSL